MTELRPYQKDAVDQIRAHARAGGKGAILQLATGAGKTVVFCDVLKGAHSKGNRGLMLVKGKSLVHQTAARLEREGVPHGIYQAKNTRGTHEQILVCSVDTLFARKEAPPADIVVIDECFPGGTLIDGRPIERLSMGDLVWSYDHVSGIAEKKRILATRKSIADAICVIWTNSGRRIVCTPNHPVYADGNYCEAEKIRVGQTLSRMPTLSEKIQDKTVAALSGIKRQNGLLFPLLLRYRARPKDIGGEKEGQRRVSPRSSTEDLGHAQEDRAQAANSGRKWPWSDSAATSYGEGDWIDYGTHCHNRDGARFRGLSDTLQIGFGPPRDETSDRDRWGRPYGRESERARPAKNPILRVERVASVEIHERGSSEAFERLCPGGFVYNLQVEKNENYFAEGFLVHNCHLSHSDGFRWVLGNYPGVFKLGVSATPHHRKGMGHIGDRLVRPIGITELIAQGYLVGARYFVPYVPNMRGVAKSGGDYNTKQLGKKALEDEELTASAKGVWSKNLRGKSTLVFAVSVEHARVLLAGLRESGARGEIIVANTPDERRRDCIKRLEGGELDVLVSVGVLTTGVDVPSLRAILCCRPTESYNLWIQILGRGTRPFSGKSNFLVYDLSGNLYKHGPIEAEAIASLDGGTLEIPKVRLKTCPDCYAVFEPDPESSACPSCGADCTETRDRTSGTRIHGLTENDEVIEVKVEPWELDLQELVAVARLKGLRKGWVYHSLKGKYGEETANKAWPRIRALKKWVSKNHGVGRGWSKVGNG